MKKTIFFLIVMIFTMSASTAFASKSEKKSASDNSAVPVKTENRLSEEEVSRLTKRVEEIRDMDKSNLTAKEKSELKKELKETKKNVRHNSNTFVIGGVTLLLIIIIIILLV